MHTQTGESQTIGSLRLDYKTYERQRCFVGHSHEAEWRDDIVSACDEVLPKFGLEPWYAADHFDPTRPLRDKVVQAIANARYGIYDLSRWQDKSGEWHAPRNVFIELGMAIALNRPALLLRHTSNASLPVPTCLRGVEMLEFAGETTLKRALEARLPQWIDAPPDRDWLNRFCIFGKRVCGFREAHPRVRQWGSSGLCCHVADGLDKDHPRFQQAERDETRGALEEIFRRYTDLAFSYLDELPVADGYQFILCSHCQAVRSTPFAVYRITPQTPTEVFIAIGMSIALETLFEYDIPKVLLVRHEQDLPSLLRGYEVVEVASSSEAKKKLKVHIPAVMQKVGETMWRPRPLPFIEVPTQPRVKPISPQLEEAPVSLRNEKAIILLVDNDPEFLDIYKKILERQGYRVITATDPIEARKILQQDRIHLAVLGLRLVNDADEKDVSGLALAQEEAFKHIPKIIMSRFPTYAMVRNALSPRADRLPPAVDFIAKAEGPQAMLLAIEKVLSQRGLQG